MMNRGGGHRYLYDDRLASTVSFLVQTPGSARLVLRILAFYFFGKISLFKMTIGRG